jgi:hypothetical protein
MFKFLATPGSKGWAFMEFMMSTKRTLARLAAISALLIALAPMSTAAAQGHFNCRASAVRLGLPLGQVVEPMVANAPGNPCATDFKSSESYQDSLGLGVSTGAVIVKTYADALPLYAQSKLDRVAIANLLGLVSLNANSIRSGAKILAGPKGECRLSGSSSLSGLNVLGQSFDSLRTPLDLDVKYLGVVVAKLHLNATIGGLHPTIGEPNPNKITQRAVWLHVTGPVLLGTLADLIMGEASAAAAGGVSCS